MEKKPRYPKSIPFIIGNEVAERFSFYGMKAILTVYLIQGFAFSAAQANEKTHLFIALAYFFSIIGGTLADYYLGKYKTILYLSLVYCAGHCCLAIFDSNLDGFLFGLLLIVIGAGGIKPCVSANVGDQFDASNGALLGSVFSIFYFSVNLGAFVSTLFVPLLLKHYGPAVAFGVPGVLMGIATLLFWSGRKTYVRVPPSGFNKENFLAVSAYAMFNLHKKQKGQHFLDIGLNKFSQEAVENVKAVWRVLVIFSFIPVFWALYDQNGSEWVIQAASMDLHFMGHTWLPEQIQALNPVLILVFIPLFSLIIYPAFEKMGIRVTSFRKIGAGLLLTACSFIVIALIQEQIDRGAHPGIGWQLLAYLIITAAEILISITGLEFAYTQAPKAMKSTLMSFWLLTVFTGNIFVAFLNSNKAQNGFLSSLKGAAYYCFFFWLMVAFLVLYLIVSGRFREKNVYMKGPESLPA
jgi:POT family proton-dependent oligopeptide transporter